MTNPEFMHAQPEWQPWMERSSSLASVSVFLSDKEGRLLMVQDREDHGGKWSPIAGYIDDLMGEEPEIAALREAKEELGLDIQLDTLLGVWHYYENGSAETAGVKKDKHKMHVGYAYTGTILGGTFEMQQEEIQNWGFFTPQQVEQMLVDGSLKTPEYNYRGFKLWEKGACHPLDIIQSNSRTKFT